MVARLETWREHNCLALSVRGESWEEALVLDGWRHAGRLSWVLVKADKYPWQERVFATND